MANKRKKIIVSIISLLMIVGIGLYFYLPKMLADEVYPLKYEDLIKKYATKYSVDPALVAGTIFVESRFDKDAVSYAKARGLMQMTDATFATMLAEVGRPTNSKISDPEVAIDTGTAHLRDLMVWSKGNRQLAEAAYNLGTGKAAIYQGTNKVSYLSYVKKVDHAITVYRTIYASELGYNSSPIELKAQEQADKQAEIRGFFWVQLFQNVFRITG